jgi:DNA-binding transcriptional MocR family regulator
LSERRRRQIIEIAARHGVSIVEDDICGFLPREAPPPIASLAPEITWYATGLNKAVSPGIRIGYLLAPSAVDAEDITARFKATSTWFAAPLSAELAIAWINGGVALRTLGFIQSESAARQTLARKILAGADIMGQPEALQIWLRLPEGRPVDRLAEDAHRSGVIVGKGAGFMPVGAAPLEAVRICLGAAASAEELETALSALAGLL